MEINVSGVSVHSDGLLTWWGIMQWGTNWKQANYRYYKQPQVQVHCIVYNFFLLLQTIKLKFCHTFQFFYSWFAFILTVSSLLTKETLCIPNLSRVQLFYSNYFLQDHIWYSSTKWFFYIYIKEKPLFWNQNLKTRIHENSRDNISSHICCKQCLKSRDSGAICLW